VGPGGVDKSTLALKFAAGQAERCGLLLLVFRLSVSSRTTGSARRDAGVQGLERWESAVVRR
jgi:hypothetical protein